MMTTTLFDIHPTRQSRLGQVDLQDLPFGSVFSDHMFVMDFKDGQWQTGAIQPYADIAMSPAAMALHYGQAIFEGMKAFRQPDGGVALFRPDANIARFNVSADRMCMPAVDPELFHEALVELVKMDSGWVPDGAGSSLYIRPFMFASEVHVGVRPSAEYRFIIFTCPVGPYYKGSVRVKVETEYTRAAPGGTGYAKAAGNYAASLKPTELAKAAGYQQILWTDAVEHKYIEESGTMNAVFVLDGNLVSPSLGDTVLNGVTRNSVLKLARHFGLEVEERRIAVAELKAAAESGALTEAFGVGTAATMTPIEAIGFNAGDVDLPALDSWTVMPRLAATLDGIRRGHVDDPFDWRLVL
jgi:branched-chain amino acid aminotransferase